MSWKQIKREGIVVKFRKLLAMVLAVAMIASLAPVLRTTAKADGETGNMHIDVESSEASGSVTFRVTKGNSDSEEAVFTNSDANYYGNGVTVTEANKRLTFTVTLSDNKGSIDLKNLPVGENYKVAITDPTHEDGSSLSADKWTIIHGKKTKETVTERKLNGISADIKVSATAMANVRFDCVKAGENLSILTISSDNADGLVYTVTGTTSLKDYVARNAGTAVSGDEKSFTVTVKSGNSHSLVLPVGEYTITQNNGSNKFTSTKHTVDSGSDEEGVAATVTTSATERKSTTYTNSSAPVGSVTYHLNIPKGVRTDGVKNLNQYKNGDEFKDFTYYSESTTVLELNEIESFKNDTLTITGDTSPNYDPEDDFVSYNQGYLGSGDDNDRYFFVGWSRTPNATFKPDGSVDYKNIDFPVVYLKGSGEKDRGVRAIYGYRSDNENDKLNGPYTVDAGTELYAVWAKNTNSGLMGYALQINDAYFGSDADKDNPFTTSDSYKLAFNGRGKEGALWYKYVDLDSGHKDGENYTITSDLPKYTGSDVKYTNGTRVATAFAAWRVNDGGKEGKNEKFVADGGQTVKYTGGGTTVSSLDAMWATTTAPNDQKVGYNGSEQAPDFSNLKTEFNNNYSTTATLNKFAANDTNSNRSPFILYDITVEAVDGHGTVGSSSTTSAVGLAGTKVPTVTEPGVYRYTIKAKYSIKDPKDPNATSNQTDHFENELGTVSFLFIIQPRLTLNVTKNLTGREWKSDDSFAFSVTSDKTGATVETGTLTISDNVNPNASTNVNFTAAGEYTITIHETTTDEPGMTYAADQTVKIRATADANGFITLEDASGTTSATVGTDGNATAAVTMTNAYNTGSLTVTKEVAPSTTSKGDGKDFTITVTLTKGEFPETLSTDIVGTATATRTSATVVTLSLQKGASVTIKDLPVGAEYTVEETNPGDGSTSSITSGGSGTIKAGSNEVTVTNTYPAPTGKLTITKTVIGTNAPSEWSFEFTVKAPSGVTFDAGTSYGTGVARVDANTLKVTVSNSDTDGVTIENLPIGDYTVTETDVDGYEITVATDDDVTYASGNSFTAAITEDGETTAAVTNTFLTGNLTINKKVDGTNAPASDTFTFTVKATGDTVAKVADKEFDSVNFGSDGSATVTITVSLVGSNITGTKTITGLPIGTYTVVEDTSGLTNYGTPTYSNDANTAGVTVTKDRTAEVTVTNHYDQPTGNLTITKTVAGVASASGQEFTFTITAPSDKTVDGTSFTVTGATAGTITFSGGTATVTVKMDAALTKTVTIAGLPIGYYKVEEKPTSPDNYNTSYSGNANTTGVNVTESGGEVTVTNTHKTGDLTINKTVTGSGPAVPTNGTFTFTITAPDGLIAAGTSFNLEGAAGTVTFTDGKTATVTVSVSGGTGSTTIENLPIGTYTVTETVPAGYQVDGDNPKSVSLTTSGAAAEFINTYQTGTLKITKTVDGIASASGKEFTFTITAPKDKIADGTKFTVPGASDITFNGDKATVTIVMDTALTKTVTIANLPAGSYSVSEKAADHYTVKETEPQTVKITSNGDVERVSFTNTYDTGSLTITKNVTGGTNVKVSQTFTFTVQAPANLIKEGASFDVSNGTSAKFNGGEAEVTVTLSNSDTGSVTIEGLPVGEYTITEKEAQGYTIPDPVTVNVAKGTTPVPATITNTVQTTSLTIGKTVVYPTDFPADKKLDANVVEYTFTVAFKDFPAGVTSFDLNVGGTSKTVTTADNTVIVPLKAGVQTELKNIPIGIGYEVTEAFQSDDLGRHFTTVWTTHTGVVESDTNVTCTNTYHMLEKGNGALVIRKEAIGGQADTKYQFKVTFTQGGNPYTGQIGGKTLGSDGSATFEMDDTANHSLVIQVPVGVAYKVEEVFASGERPKAISVRLEQNEAGDSTSGETASGTISQEFNYDSVIFTNSYLGDLTISKTVPQFDGGEVFTFTVTLPTGTYNYTGDKSGTISSGGTVTLKAGETITIQNLPAGSGYAVTEAGTANYTSSSVGATGTIANNTTAEAKFTNNRNTGSLTVTKTLTGKLAASNDTFTFTVTLTGVGTGFNGTLGDVTFTNGVGTFTIKGGESKTISGLPVGAGFTVKEQDAAGYVTTYNNDPANHDKAEGTISANPTTVTVNNDKPDTGTITITKVVENAPAADANKEFEFTITLYLDEDLTEVARDVNGEHSGFNFINGVANFTLKNGDSVIGEGEVTVSEGRLFYKIEETADPNYTTSSKTSDTNGKANGRVVTGEFTQDSQNTTVTFTNTYNYGDLTITKKVTDDSGASHASDKFTFTITKKGDSTFNQKVEINGANSETVTLPAGEYIVTETAGMGDSVAYKVGTSGSSAANAEVTITAGGTVTVTVTNTYYSGGGTGGGGGGTPSPDIDTSEHYGYIIGVTHTEVAPEQNITRAEIATILFRLLTDEARAANWSENSGFPDVKSGVWYNHAVAVLHKMGIILGDDNGNFNPDQNITRAEVAAMVVRFYEVAEGTVLNNRFTDVETTKWYAEAVLLADYYGLMQGDGDTFKPEDLLTRAEAMTVFNRLLGRKPHKDHLHKDMITWTDNTDRNKWYYAEVQEATNSHTCGNNVVIDGKIYETWSAITKMRDWAALEY